jgi:N-acetyl-anhydromuramyl-L-alanine amidase AmpD
MSDLKIVKKPLKTDQYYQTAHKKQSIFLHHTAGGTAEGAIRWFDQTPEAVGTAYVIDRDGTIFQVFDDAKWAFHLGVKGDNNDAEKQSIGIEIVARGWLVEENGKFFHYPLFPNKAGKTEIPKDEVWEFKNKWQGYKYYHKYTDAQIRATVALVAMLMKKYDIKPQKDFDKFFQFNPDVAMKNLPGIWSHTAVRKDKTDIVPHEDFVKPLKELMAEIAKK